MRTTTDRPVILSLRAVNKTKCGVLTKKSRIGQARSIKVTDGATVTLIQTEGRVEKIMYEYTLIGKLLVRLRGATGFIYSNLSLE
jgi:hypothetical protein